MRQNLRAIASATIVAIVLGSFAWAGTRLAGDQYGGSVVATSPITGTGTVADPLTLTASGIVGVTINPTGVVSGNDWAPTGHATATRISATLTGDAAVTGLTAGVEGRTVQIYNIDTTDVLTLVHQSASSAAANRFVGPLSSDIVLSPAGDSVTLDYVASRWVARGRTRQPQLILDGTSNTATLFMTAGGATLRNVIIPGATNLDGILLGNVATAQTTSTSNIASTITGTYNTTAQARQSYGLKSSNTAARSSGANDLTNYGVYAIATGGQVNYSGYFDTGLFHVVGASTLDSSLSVAGSSTLGDTAADAITFANGPNGVNLYAGKHLEFLDEWLGGTRGAQTYGDITTMSFTGAGATSTSDAGWTTRPGVHDMSSGTTTTGRACALTGTDIVDFGSGTWVSEWTGGVSALSTAGEEFVLLVGFFDTATSVNQVDGCYALYDRLNAATSGPNTGNAEKLSCWCVSNSTRTTFLMDGTAVSDESFTTVNAPVAAAASPNTNMLSVKVQMTGTTRAEFYVDTGAGYTKRCNISTNIPSGAARMTGAGALFLKSAGTTPRHVYMDRTRLAVDLTTARTP